MGERKAKQFALWGAACLLFFVVSATRLESKSEAARAQYKVIENWANLPAGRTWGSVAGITIDRHGNIWVFERCGANSCLDRTENPILEFDPSGQLLRQFGAGLLVFPHGIFVDKNGNVWVTDGQGSDGKGQQVLEFSPNGKILMKLGRAGVGGTQPDTFNRPSGVVVAPNGDIFVADGHHEDDSNARVVKFSKSGKFIKAWGKRGSAPGDFNDPHAITMDSRGRIFVADRGNNRIQIFDQDGKFLQEWTQFGRPSGFFVDKNDVIYVCDNTDTRYPDWKRGIRIGSAKNGHVEDLIPDPDQDFAHELYGAESVVADANGNIYAAEVKRKMVKKYLKE